MCSQTHANMNIPTIRSTVDTALSGQLDTAINNKTKPPGSLGVLEILAKQIGLIQQTVQPHISDPAIIVFAGDHGVVAENISVYRSEEHTSELQSLMRISYAVFCLKKKTINN